MQILSATQAIGPAWNHTRDLLLRPRRWQLLLKIGAVAVFAQMGGGGCNARLPMNAHDGVSKLPPAFAGALIAFILLAAVVGLLLALLFLYIGSRLQFVLFDVVLRRDTTVGPIWRRFGGVTWRWIGLKVLFLFLGTLAAALLALPFVFAFFRIFHGGAHPGFMSYLPLILAAVFVGLLWLVAFMVCFVLLTDFGLPSIALEATPMRETLRRIIGLLRLETGQVLFYILLRVCLGIAGVLVAEVVLLLGALVAFALFGGVGLALWFGLHKAALMGKVFLWLGFGILGLIFLTLFFIVAIILLGYVYTFLQAYAVYFLAGRYPLMGELLDRYTPPPPAGFPPLYPYPPPPIVPVNP